MLHEQSSRKKAAVATLSLVCLINAGCIANPIHAKGVKAFEEIPVDFEHQWQDGTHPLSGAAVIDTNGDGQMEVFVGGGQGQADALLSYSDTRLVNTIAGTGLSNLSATYGSVSIDIDNDKDIDLIVARNDGLYQYLNHQGTFTEQKIPLQLPDNSVPFGIAVSDIDHDGDGDLYISVFVAFPQFRTGVFNDPEHAKRNILLLNNGDASFTDITESS